MATCPKCRFRFSVLEDEDDGQHGCSRCGYGNRPEQEPEMNITYTLSLTVTRPVRSEDAEVSLDHLAAWMESAEAKRELEREVLGALRKLDGDCDIEVMSTEKG